MIFQKRNCFHIPLISWFFKILKVEIAVCYRATVHWATVHDDVPINCKTLNYLEAIHQLRIVVICLRLYKRDQELDFPALAVEPVKYRVSSFNGNVEPFGSERPQHMVN